MASTSLNHIFCYESTSTITTIHYNPYKPNIMAAGTAGKSILLFFTASHTLSNLYASFSHLPGQQDYCPEGIQTEFEIKDISWSPQNPSTDPRSFSHCRRFGCLRHGGRQRGRCLGHSPPVVLIGGFHVGVCRTDSSRKPRKSTRCAG